jgi:hypothetical protein
MNAAQTISRLAALPDHISLSAHDCQSILRRICHDEDGVGNRAFSRAAETVDSPMSATALKRLIMRTIANMHSKPAAGKQRVAGCPRARYKIGRWVAGLECKAMSAEEMAVMTGLSMEYIMGRVAGYKPRKCTSKEVHLENGD